MLPGIGTQVMDGYTDLYEDRVTALMASAEWSPDDVAELQRVCRSLRQLHQASPSIHTVDTVREITALPIYPAFRITLCSVLCGD